uniref:THH1/TOM1/TOM3 domain-containing protein n=1 Tax=Bicosoecida sp. CB-2014 TaxID=1486930 RepID=A0A7S1CSG1_9STRA
MAHEGTFLDGVPPRDVGWVGAALFAALGVGALTRLAATGGACCVACRPCTPRKRFYCMVVLLAALDAPRYIIMGMRGAVLDGMTDDLARWTYAAHLIALWSQLVGLSIIAGLFANVFSSHDAPPRGRPRPSRAVAAATSSKPSGPGTPGVSSASEDDSMGSRGRGGFGRHSRLIPAPLLVCGTGSCAERACGPWPPSAVLFACANTALLVVTLALVRNLLTQPSTMTFDKALAACSLYLPFVCVVAGVLLLVAAGLVSFGMRVRARIARHNWGPNHRSRIARVVSRLTVTLAMCAACYALRVAALFSLFSADVRNNRIFSPIVWECLSYWVPTIVPSAVLLIMMRGPGAGGGTGGGAGTSGATVAAPGAHHWVAAGGANAVVANNAGGDGSGSGGGRSGSMQSPLLEGSGGQGYGGYGSELSDVSSGDDFA